MEEEVNNVFFYIIGNWTFTEQKESYSIARWFVPDFEKSLKVEI